MSKPSRATIIVLGLCCSVLMGLGAAFALEGNAALAGGVVGSSLGWALLTFWRSESGDRAVQAEVAPSEVETWDSVQSVLGDAIEQARKQHEAIRSEVDRVQAMLSEAIATLTGSFHGILAATNAQQSIAVSLAQDDDPRQDGAFAVAWTLGLATQIAPAGLQVWTPAGLTGPRGLFHTDGRARPLAAVVARLAGLAGQPVSVAELGGGRSRLVCGGRVLEANLTATAQGPLPPYGWREDLQAGRQGTMP